MTDAVLVAIIGLVGTVLGAFTGFSHKSKKKKKRGWMNTMVTPKSLPKVQNISQS